MEGISLVETASLQALITSIEDMKMTVVSTMEELKNAKKDYLTVREVMEITGFTKQWVTNYKQNIGFTCVGSHLRFKRQDVEDFMNRFYVKPKK
jgi:hypothetical protein